jgi:hypothetical protein
MSVVVLSTQWASADPKSTLTDAKSRQDPDVRRGIA